MKIQTLVVTMNQTDHSLLKKMNIQTDAIVGNQCDRNEIEEFDYCGHKVRWFSLAERGVGLNRNNTLMRADGDIVLFADDDVVYYDGYADTILNYYKTHTDADVVIFNFWMRRGTGDFYERVKKAGRVRKWNASKYGTYCISARTESVRFANISFHLLFGGGTRYSCGEDTLFIHDCLKKGLKVYKSTDILGVLDHGESTWFSGYTDKFFYDKGVLYALIIPLTAYFAAIYHCVRHRRMYREFGCKRAVVKMFEGIRFAKHKRIVNNRE